MNQDKFVSTFTKLLGDSVWSYDKNKLLNRISVRGVATVLNPVTFVAFHTTGIVFENTKRGTLRAARSIGITPELAMAVYSTSNRGHSQIIRGKLLKTLFI